jgi:hypothetical protein
MPDLNSDLDDALEPIVRFLQAALRTTIEGHLVRAYIQGDKELIYWGITKGGIPIAYEGPPIEQAVNWARDYCAKLVTKMDEETKAKLAQVVSDAIQNKRGIPGLARDIRMEFEKWKGEGVAKMTRYRSELIAKTETRNALWKGSHEKMVDIGVDGHQWYLGSGGATGNCEDCIANAAVGIIPIGEDFPTPEGGIHPGCTCAIAPAMMYMKKD